MKQNLVGKILGKIKIFGQDFVTIKTGVRPLKKISLVFCHRHKKYLQDDFTAYHQKVLPATYFLPFTRGGSYGNKILYKNLDLTQDFPNKTSFHFLWVKMLPKNLPKIFRWPEMCPLDKILAQDFQMAAFTKILGRRDTSVVPLLSTENCKTLF